ncbi:hypothetical protein M948_05975 [Virgibacillus sp. CM-4]|uniref:hypothetical protein n=1 Tax=Virgibacillus sp. CM-4 TaxID=1354277 RepID=UPI000388224E|nr:hypothetical protein [Virgibacillus sp. CM-4]EQB38120.1 hypothetical protein M948_05975 [Virgibacillus sp. CM-4]
MFEEYTKVTVENLDNLNIEDNTPTYLTVLLDGVPFEFLVNIKSDSNNMIVFGSGAYDSQKMKPPIFNRFSWKDTFDCSTIFYNDPTLYLGDINLGWGYGTQNRHYLSEISNIIRRIRNNVGISNKNILFFGSSGGGFMSLMLSAMIKGSRSFVNNPQTVITNYYKSHVSNLHKVVYGNDQNNRFVNNRSNVTELFKRLESVPEVFYAQNMACKHDMDNHVFPFLKGLNSLKDRVFNNKVTMYYYSDKEQGHNPLDNKTTIRLIKRILDE